MIDFGAFQFQDWVSFCFMWLCILVFSGFGLYRIVEKYRRKNKKQFFTADIHFSKQNTSKYLPKKR